MGKPDEVPGLESCPAGVEDGGGEVGAVAHAAAGEEVAGEGVDDADVAAIDTGDFGFPKSSMIARPMAELIPIGNDPIPSAVIGIGWPPRVRSHSATMPGSWSAMGPTSCGGREAAARARWNAMPTRSG